MSKENGFRMRRLGSARSIVAAVGAVLVAIGGIAAPASAAVRPPAAVQSDPTSIDDKYEAAAVLGWVPREEVTLSDRNFVTVLWEKASERHNPEVKEAARRAFSDATDAEAASARFITVGIFEANDRDVARKALLAELSTIRLRAAQEINWVPATNTERNTLLDQTLQNFLLDLWRRAANWPQVKAAAEPLTRAEATDDQRLEFLKTDLFAKAEADRQNEIAEGNAEEVAAQRAAALRSAKQKAVAAALRRSATPYELDDLDDRELIYTFATDSPGTRVKAAATVAYADPSPDAWLAFIYTGVHLANKVDLDERDLADARANEVRVRDIMYAAEEDGFLPNVVAAAKTALEGVALARSQFLLGGHDTARAADIIKPAAHRTVMLQAVGYKACVAEPQWWFAIQNYDERNARLDPCNQNLATQLWSLLPNGDGRYRLQGNLLENCLYPAVGKEQQDGAPIVGLGCGERDTDLTVWELMDAGNGTVEIRNVSTNKVMTVAAGSKTGYRNLVQDPNGHLATQKWRLIDPTHQATASKPPTGSFRIKNVKAGRCLRPAGALDTPGEGGLAPYAKVEVRDCGDGPEQIWDVLSVSGTRFELRNRATQWCLLENSFALETVGREGAAQSYCGYSDSQWAVMHRDGGVAHLRSADNGLYLATPVAETANGTVVTQAEYSTSSSQKWRFEPVAEGSVAPAKLWTPPSSAPQFAGTQILYQPECARSIVGSGDEWPVLWRTDWDNATRGLIRDDDRSWPYGDWAKFDVCAVGAVSNNSIKITMKNADTNAFVREATTTDPDRMLVADQTNAEKAEHFVLQDRLGPQRGCSVLQSLSSKKYAARDLSATGSSANAVRFFKDGPTDAGTCLGFWIP